MTDRLRLRPFVMADAPQVQQLVSDRAIADTTLNIPHPYPEDGATEWIAHHQEKVASGEAFVWAITAAESGTLLGSISLHCRSKHSRAELGYWIGVPFWGSGYCTEAARVVVRFGFDEINLNRIFAHHMTRNPASGRVLQKLGMKHEGTLRQHIRKWHQYEDLAIYAILQQDYKAATDT